MEGIAIEYFPSSFEPGNNKQKSEFHSYISDDNEQDTCDSHANMFHLYIYIIRNISVWYVNIMARHRWSCQAI